MNFFRHIENCNKNIQGEFIPWKTNNRTLGWISKENIFVLKKFPNIFHINNTVRLKSENLDFKEISNLLAEVADYLAANKIIPQLMNELYPVTYGERKDAIAVIDRAATSFFGLRAFGQHLNGFVKISGEIHIWVAKRAYDRHIFPGALDNMVAGGLPYGISLRDNLAKECWEEAGMPDHIVETASPVGLVTYNKISKHGFRPDILYCYDIELDPNFIPKNTDGEVESFNLIPVREIMEIVKNSDRFKTNCNLVVIDFLIRHGFISPSHEEYLSLCIGLRQNIGNISNAQF
tara:strand:- start:3768 stop:4640 length:873 start_codon:yes stop_codon:yes gene_type:complete